MTHKYCAARNYQGILHLHLGMGQNCCHTMMHKSELSAEDPGRLLNTLYSKIQRKRLAEDNFPSDCRYCEQFESVGDTSERSYRNKETWAPLSPDKDLQAAKEFKPFIPRTLQISFTNYCNFKCTYCGPRFSSQWQKDVRSLGDYQVYQDKRYSGFRDTKTYNHGEENPFLDQFWKWYPEVSKELDTLRISGGEPFLDKNTEKMLHLIKQSKHQLNEFSMTTNLGVSREILTKKLNLLKELYEGGSVKKCRLYISIDTIDPRIEYIRNGIDINLFKENMSFLLEDYPFIHVSFISTYTLFSLTTFDSFVEYYISLKRDHSNEKEREISIDTPILVHPAFLSPLILPKEFSHYPVDSFKKMQESKVFTKMELEKFERIVHQFKYEVIDVDNLSERKMHFKSFVHEYDKRSGTDFVQTFPELKDFFSSI